MVQKKFLFLLLALTLKIIGCEENTMLICGIKACMHRTASIQKLYSHRFRHTLQRPFHCSNCSYSGYQKYLEQHLKLICKNAFMCETIFTDETSRILTTAPLIERHIELDDERVEKKLLFYRCAFRNCRSKSHLLSKIAKHRVKKHVKQKKYTCSLCFYQCNKKAGRSHVKECSEKHAKQAQLLRNIRKPTTMQIINRRPVAYYDDGSSKTLDEWHIDDATSIEYLSDSEEQNTNYFTDPIQVNCENVSDSVIVPASESLTGSPLPKIA